MEITQLARDIATAIRANATEVVALGLSLEGESIEEIAQAVLDKAEAVGGFDFSDYDSDDDDDDDDDYESSPTDDDYDSSFDDDDDDDELESDDDVRADLQDAIGDVNSDYLDHGHDN